MTKYHLNLSPQEFFVLALILILGIIAFLRLVPVALGFNTTNRSKEASSLIRELHSSSGGDLRETPRELFKSTWGTSLSSLYSGIEYLMEEKTRAISRGIYAHTFELSTPFKSPFNLKINHKGSVFPLNSDKPDPARLFYESNKIEILFILQFANYISLDGEKLTVNLDRSPVISVEQVSGLLKNVSKIVKRGA